MESYLPLILVHMYTLLLIKKYLVQSLSFIEFVSVKKSYLHLSKEFCENVFNNF